MTMSNDRDTRHSSWDFGLIVATVGLLGALGVQSLVGTLYAWWAYRTVPGWETAGYQQFVEVMNAVAAPMVVALVLAMGLCVPKRLFERRTLAAVSAAMLVAGLAVGLATRSVATGLVVYLGVSALVQVAVVVLAVTARQGVRRASGGLAKTGSGLLHLGFIVFAIVIAGLQDSSAMLPIFWLAAALIVGGSALSFYARPRTFSSERGE